MSPVFPKILGKCICHRRNVCYDPASFRGRVCASARGNGLKRPGLSGRGDHNNIGHNPEFRGMAGPGSGAGF